MWRRTVLRSSVVLAAAGVCVAGWNGWAAAAQGTKINSAANGFAFVLPAGWKSIPVNGSNVSGLLKLAAKNDPKLAQTLNSQVEQATERGTKVYAIGPVSGQNAPNINVIVTSGAGAPTGDAFASAVVGQAKQELSSVGATHVTASVVHSQLGATAQSTYTLPSSISKGSPLAGYQIYALHGSRVYVVTITTTSAALDRSVANKVKGSWTWK
jgi:hypothetical protein